MMNKPNNWDDVKPAQERMQLPVGAYECRIISAKVVDYTDKNTGELLFQRLEIAFDISSGDFKGYYQDDFNTQQGEDKKWKGVLRQYLPKDDGSDKDEWTKSTLKAMINAFEDSNPGFHFDWDEAKLNGKAVGVLFRNEQWVMQGRDGWKAQPFKAISIDAVREGTFKLPKDKPHKDAPPAGGFSEIKDDDDVPF